MNNNMFTLMRNLRDLGVDAYSLHLGSERRGFFRPGNDAYDISKYEKRMIWLDWGSKASYFFAPKRRIRESLEGYDVLIGCGYVPYFLERSGMRLDIFVPYGSDVYDAPFPRWEFSALSFAKKMFAKGQREGIGKCKVVVPLVTHEPAYRAALSLNKNCIPLLFQCVYERDFEGIVRVESTGLGHKAEFQRIRDEHEVVIFNHSRQVWKTRTDAPSIKRNDVLIRAFAVYCKRGKKKAALVLFEYGPDVEASRRLINDLGVEGSVFWMPKMGRRELMYGLSLADFASGQFYHGAVIFGASVESMVLGKPIFTYSDLSPEEFSRRLGGVPLPPILNVHRQEEITEHLLRNDEEPDYFVAVGRKTREWYDEHMGTNLVKRWVKLIETVLR